MRRSLPLGPVQRSFATRLVHQRIRPPTSTLAHSGRHVMDSLEMTHRILKQGKLPSDLLEEVLGLPRPGSPEVRVGPQIGEDACAIDVPAGTLLAASDPITLTGTDIARFVVIVNANDVAVMGARPQWFLATVLLPTGTTEDQVRELFGGLHRAVSEVGARLVGGHTEVTAAVTQPVIVGTMLGLAATADVVTTGGARPGDLVVQIGGVPIEGAAVLAVDETPRLEAVNIEIIEQAAAARDNPGISVVEQALTAAELGATAMHDPTEGGILGGLHELAMASRTAVRVDCSKMIWFEPGITVCRAVGLDPWATLASGSLLATFGPDDVEAALAAFRTGDHDAAVIATVEDGAGVCDTTGRPMARPERDEIARLFDK